MAISQVRLPTSNLKIVKDFDNYNYNRLKKFHLPVIKSVNQLLEVLELKDKEEKFFYSKNRSIYLYKKFEIEKQNGGSRIIEKPNAEILPTLKALNNSIFCEFKVDEHCCGFVKGKSIVDNALPHMGAKVLIKFDIENFFPSINIKKINYALRYFGYGKNVSRYLSYLCVNKNFELPQGSPVSPIISNIVATRMDARISGLLSKKYRDFSLKFTRYADDITISSKERISKEKISLIIQDVKSIIINEGFKPNYNKLKVYSNRGKILVTGLIVNDKKKVTVDKHIVREIENAIRYIPLYGLNNHMSHLKIYSSESTYIEHLYGLCSFVKMVDNEKGTKLFIKLCEVFNGIKL